MRDAQQSVHLIAATVGFLSYGILWISVIWGVVLKNGWAFTRVRHATVYGIHQIMTLLGLTLGVVHGFAQLAVPGGPVRLVDQFVPFANPQDPIGIGLGVIALELMVALALSVLVQRWLGHHRWRKLHMLGYLAYVLLTAHVLMSGSDTGSMLVRLPIIASLLAVVALAAASLQGGRMSRRPGASGSNAADVVLNVDPGRCVRYGFCAHEAPALFRLRSDGRMNYRAAVPAEHVDDALRAAEACPARAIMIGRRPTAVVMATQAGPEPTDSGRDAAVHRINGGRVESRH